MKILFLIHIEEEFRAYMEGSNPYLLENIAKLIRSEGYDQIYAFCTDFDTSEPLTELKLFIDEVIPWSYGYERECFADDERAFLIDVPENGNTTWIPQNLRNNTTLHESEIYIGGGAECECLVDFLAIMKHEGYTYKVLYEIVY
jgi:hypothetical protein